MSSKVMRWLSDGAIDHIAGHQFGQAGGIALLMLVTGSKDGGGVIHQHPGTGLNGRRRHVGREKSLWQMRKKRSQRAKIQQ